jgi:regulator of PEP synthase PpsR (kinase-PPPase family)
MDDTKKFPPIYVVSGGKGIAGDVMVHSTLIQFPGNKIPVITVPDVINEEKLQSTIKEVKSTNGVIVHTMVDTDIRNKLKKLCKENNIRDFDMMGDLSDYVTQLTGVEPMRIPGLYRKLNHQYFDRIASIEYTIAHDDGLDPERILNADVVLTGVSRAGKTPLSIYMAMFGWKVANVPLVNGIEPPDALFKVDPGRVFGLTISINQLMNHRNKRVERLGANFTNFSYIEPHDVRNELDWAESIFRKGNFTIIDVTYKPIESTANEIIRQIIQRYPQNEQRESQNMD